MNLTSFSLSPIGRSFVSTHLGKLPIVADSRYILALSIIQTSSMTLDVFFDILVLRLSIGHMLEE